MKKIHAIISQDRHRDDYVYIVECEDSEVESYIKEIWDKDFNFNGQHEATYKSPYQYMDDLGSSRVEEVIIETIN